jgi:dTDP-4-amino-4,6-dideoxygalactose transaminase
LTALISDGDATRHSNFGGTSTFRDRIPLTRTPAFQRGKIGKDIDTILASGILSNGPYVRQLEQRAAAYLGVSECVAVSSHTTGLLLVLRAVGLVCEVVVPAFGFEAVARAAAWNGLQVSFADIDPHTLTVCPRDAADAVGIRTSALLGVHTFGTPCAVDELEELAERNGIPLLFDAGDAFGSRRRGAPLGGSGDAEVFSLSSTRVVTGGEGGLIATDDPELAERCRVGRDDGNPGDDPRFIGLNARMSEVHAALALSSMEDLEDRMDRNNLLAAAYRRLLGEVEGIDLPGVRDGDRGSCNGFTILVDPDRFGLDAERLGDALAGEGIETRSYRHGAAPHGRHASFGRARELPVAVAAASRALTLPLWPDLAEQQLARVVEVIAAAPANLEPSRPKFISA